MRYRLNWLNKETDKRKFLAGVAGFEPTMTESESVALPLGDTPKHFYFNKTF